MSVSIIIVVVVIGPPSGFDKGTSFYSPSVAVLILPITSYLYIRVIRFPRCVIGRQC